MIRLRPLWRVLDPVETKVLRAIRSRRHPFLDRLAEALGFVGQHGLLWFFLGLAAARFDPRSRWIWRLVGSVGPTSILANWTIKRLFRRPRPDLGPDFDPVGPVRASSHSFPSAHATSSFAAATLAIRVEPRVRYMALPLAGITSLSRPYLGVHYPSDVLAGGLLGFGIGRVAGRLLAFAPRSWGLHAG